MTPINRLIPQTSGAGVTHRSERESVREHITGPAMTPPIRPQPSGESQGDDLVNEILRDSEDTADEYMTPIDQDHYHPPNEMQSHPSHFQEPEYPERTVHFEDEEPPTSPRPRPKANRKEEESDTDYIGMILDEMKLPLIVAVLILGASSTGLDSTIGKFIPTLLNEGNLSYSGIIMKAVIGGLLFYALHRIFL